MGQKIKDDVTSTITLLGTILGFRGSHAKHFRRVVERGVSFVDFRHTRLSVFACRVLRDENRHRHRHRPASWKPTPRLENDENYRSSTAA